MQIIIITKHDQVDYLKKTTKYLNKIYNFPEDWTVFTNSRLEVKRKKRNIQKKSIPFCDPNENDNTQIIKVIFERNMYYYDIH